MNGELRLKYPLHGPSMHLDVQGTLDLDVQGMNYVDVFWIFEYNVVWTYFLDDPPLLDPTRFITHISANTKHILWKTINW